MQCVYSNIKKQCNMFIQTLTNNAMCLFKHSNIKKQCNVFIQTLRNHAMCLFKH